MTARKQETDNVFKTIGITLGSLITAGIILASIARWSGGMEGEDKIVSLKLDHISQELHELKIKMDNVRSRLESVERKQIEGIMLRDKLVEQFHFEIEDEKEKKK